MSRHPVDVLILSRAADSHAFMVAEGIRRKGGSAIIWYTADFPSRSYESLAFGGSLQVAIRGPYQTIDDIAPRAVWNRRVSETYDVSAAHPADRLFASAQCLDLRRSMLHLIGEDSFWVNPPLSQARAILKPVQLRAAQHAGLEVPKTLCSNDPERIRAFVRDCGGRVAFKQFAFIGVWTDDDKRFAPYTTTITERDLADDARLAVAPGIFQEVVPKAHELRITAIGNRLFTTRIEPPGEASGTIDWRVTILKGARDTMSPATLPDDVANRIRAYMRKLGIVFGAFDFIVTPDGRYVFVECNEMGQFLFVEDETGAPVLDAFVSFLLQASPDFEWQERDDAIRVADLLGTVKEQMAAAAERHAGPKSVRFYEEPAVVGGSSSASGS